MITPDQSNSACGVLLCASLALFGNPAPLLAQCPPRYSVEIIAGPQCGLGPAAVFVTGLNSTGTVVGFWFCPGSNIEHAFTWSSKTGMALIDFPPEVLTSRALGITDSGAIVGDLGTFNVSSGFLKIGNTTHILGWLPGGNYSEAAAANNSNVVVGSWGNTVTGPFPRAFRWENGVMQDIDGDLAGTNSRALAINDAGAITGWMDEQSTFPPDQRGYIWDNGKVIDLGLPFPDAISTEGQSINSKGQVCGTWWRLSANWSGHEARGFLYDCGHFVDLGTLNTDRLWTQPADLNDDGVIVGRCAKAFGGFMGCAWKDGILFNLYQRTLPTPNLLRIDEAVAINNAGQIAVFGADFDFHRIGALLSPLPPVEADANCDHVIDVNDLLEVIHEWGPCPLIGPCSADLNLDGIVDRLDLIVVLVNWG